MRRIIIPFIISVIGCLTDYITTTIGLGLGFRETNPQYTVFNALLIFSLANLILACTVKNKGIWFILKIGFALLSFYGMLNNILAISGFLV